MSTIKINKISPNGYEGGIAEYDARFSPVYCLCLYVCQYVLHIDYMNKRNIENVRRRIQLGKYNTGCYYWADNELKGEWYEYVDNETDSIFFEL